MMRALAGLAPCVMLAVSCGGGPRPSARAPEDDVAALRLQLATRPRDGGLHLELARALLHRGRRGGALRHYAEAARRRSLSDEDAHVLAKLYRERAAVRLALGDSGAQDDIEAAARYRPASVRGARHAWLVREAAFAEVAAELRRADRAARARARALLERAARRWPRDARLAVLDPDTADLSALGTAGRWLFAQGARRVALEVDTAYLERGGRDRALLGEFARLFAWWHGDRELPRARWLEEMRAAGVDLCDLARSPEGLGCAAAAAEPLARVAGSVVPARAAHARAALGGWRTADPRAAAAWIEIALAAWANGDVPDWIAEVRARLDVAALAGESALAALPAAVAPTVLRAAGQPERASAALERSLADLAALSSIERAVLVAEAAGQGRPDAVIDSILHAGHVAPAGWLAALTAARDAGALARESELVVAAGPAIAEAHLRRQGDLGALARATPWRWDGALGRWRAALSGAALAPGAPALEERWKSLARSDVIPAYPSVKLGQVSAAGFANRAQDRAGLDRVLDAYRRDPALADREAEDYADRALAPGQRGPLLVRAFLALGDPARAWRWADLVLESSPQHAPYLELAAEASVATGALDRAEVFFVLAQAGSGDAGGAALRAARIYLDAGALVPAVAAARRAVELTAPGQPEHARALELAARALEVLGRRSDAAGLRAALPPGSGTPAAPQAPCARRGAEAYPARRTPAWTERVAADLACGLVATAPDGRAVLERLAGELDGAGLPALARDVRAERRALSR